MKMLPSDDQLLLRTAVGDLLARHCAPAAVRCAWEGDGRVPGLWARLGEMGVLGVTAPARVGGLGLDDTTLVLILEEAGRAACPEPLVEHAAVAVPLLAAAGEDDLATAAAAGDVCVTVQLGELASVAGATHAIVATGGDELGVVELAAGLAVHASIDGTRRLANLDAAGARPLAGVTLSQAHCRAALATAAMAVGVGAALLDTTVAYVRDRHQFGKPVGSYQAVKHQLADVALALTFARPCVTRAAWCVATADPATRRDVAAAKALAADAADLAARTALQCHGAIGYTSEYDLGLWLKRAWTLAAAFGDAAHHRGVVAEELALG
jgi:alkylation response protein AidB-like acyl-CoA dehydrogenase